MSMHADCNHVLTLKGRLELMGSDLEWIFLNRCNDSCKLVMLLAHSAKSMQRHLLEALSASNTFTCSGLERVGESALLLLLWLPLWTDGIPRECVFAAAARAFCVTHRRPGCASRRCRRVIGGRGRAGI